MKPHLTTKYKTHVAHAQLCVLLIGLKYDSPFISLISESLYISKCNSSCYTHHSVPKPTLLQVDIGSTMALKEGCLPKEAVSTVEGKSDGEILSTAFFKESKALSQYLDLPTLLPILRSKSLVTCEEFIHLATRWEKGLRESTNSLLLQLLPRKGPRWSLLLYEALQEEVEHRGHEHLVKLLQRTTAELQVRAYS